MVLKATKVDGVFTADPAKDPTATMYEQLTYSEVLEKELKVMDSGRPSRWLVTINYRFVFSI